jgi:hypothetical protein
MSTPKRVRRELDHCHAVCGELRAERDKAQRFCLLERAKRAEAETLLARLHDAAGVRMMADDPTAEERLEFLNAWKTAGEWLATLLTDARRDSQNVGHHLQPESEAKGC